MQIKCNLRICILITPTFYVLHQVCKTLGCLKCKCNFIHRCLINVIIYQMLPWNKDSQRHIDTLYTQLHLGKLGDEVIRKTVNEVTEDYAKLFKGIFDIFHSIQTKQLKVSKVYCNLSRLLLSTSKLGDNALGSVRPSVRLFVCLFVCLCALS